MMKYVIRWNTGFGDSFSVIEAEDQCDAESIAHENWKAEVDSRSDYEAVEYSETACDEAGIFYE